jgi:RNA polymerase sigma-70 factor, ECF subfamily
MTETTNTISLEALKAGDHEAFASLIEQTSAHIYHTALQILGNTQDAEDVLQETYIKALRALPTFEGRSSLSTWLYRIAVNEALMIVRRHKPNTISVEEPNENDDIDSNGMEIVDWCCLPEGDLLSSEAKYFLDQAVQHLSQPLRVVFVMRDLEGLSVQETAAVLGVSESVVKTRLLRARLALRQELSVYYAERLQEVTKR